MREILFRAKRKNWRELPKEEWWVEGYFAKLGYLKNIKYFIIQNVSLQVDISYFEDIEIDPKTLCQYICMNDNNGKKIWENDIVSINTYDYMEPQEDFFGQVVYSEGWACWCIQPPDEDKAIPLCECEGSYQTDRFVEGNVFDNPELMEQEKETEDSHGE